MDLPIEHYLVGGAVRDQLLNREVVDRDWVVIGATPRDMKRLGFKQVGRDFPVFLHPETREEFALARTERKTGSGHTGFHVHADPDVTLEEDLVRRDLTINAIAQDADGSLIDPFNGVEDLKTKTIRHVSTAFTEDPLRVFRVARFAAQLEGFTVADETLALMREMSVAGELETLSAERVWIELLKALEAPNPGRFFDVLNACSGLEYWFAEVDIEALSFSDNKSAYKHYIDLMCASRDVDATTRRLKVPKVYRLAFEDWLATHTAISAWQTTDVSELASALILLKVPHSLDRLKALIQVLDELYAPKKLLALATGFAEVTLEDAEGVSGKAYGEALRSCQETWLNQHR